MAEEAGRRSFFFHWLDKLTVVLAQQDGGRGEGGRGKPVTCYSGLRLISPPEGKFTFPSG